MSLETLSADEHQKIVDAEDRYGRYFINAHNTSIALSNIMLWPTTNCEIFIRFLSQMKKYHSLSVISTVRLHRVQAKMNLRYFLESTVHGAYALANPDTNIYFNYEASEQSDPKKVSRKVYTWIEGAYREHSHAIQTMKETINEQAAHASIINSQHNFRFVPGERAEIHTSYFDFEDVRWIKADLWQCANAGQIAMDLILAVQRQCGGFLPSGEANSLGDLIADNETLRCELESNTST